MHPIAMLLSSNLLMEVLNSQLHVLDQLAHQLRVDKPPACRRAINRILVQVKKRYENGEYDSTGAESAFRKLVEKEPSCHRPKLF